MLLTGGKANRKSRGSGESDHADIWILSGDDQLIVGLCFVGPGVRTQGLLAADATGLHTPSTEISSSKA